MLWLYSKFGLHLIHAPRILGLRVLNPRIKYPMLFMNLLLHIHSKDHFSSLLRSVLYNRNFGLVIFFLQYYEIFRFGYMCASQGKVLCKTFGEPKISKKNIFFNARSICYRNATTFLGGKQDITKMRGSRHSVCSFIGHPLFCRSSCHRSLGTHRQCDLR